MARKLIKRNAVDLFAGAGGTSTGILRAAEAMSIDLDLTAVNHWPTAINSHALNHPRVKHICENVEAIFPARLVPSRKLWLLAASCECTFHSNARGGGPCNEQSRAQPWQIIRWCTDIDVENIFMENVYEWQYWGPLIYMKAKGKRKAGWYPDKTRRGEFFNNFLDQLRKLGYDVDWKIQKAADFGDATSRRRLILMACKGRKVVWPELTHGEGRKFPYKTAREHVIDWSIRGKSIFNRKKSLSSNTVRRIIAGFQKYGGPNAGPFLAMLYGTGVPTSLDQPLPSVPGSGNHHALIEPELKPPGAMMIGQQSAAAARSVDDQVPTVAGAGAIALIQPEIKKIGSFLIPTNFGERKGQAPRTHDLDKPLPTVTGGGSQSLVEAVLVMVNHQQKENAKSDDSGHRVRSVDAPIDTVTSKGSLALAEAVLVSTNHGQDPKPRGKQSRRSKSLNDPLPTVTASPGFALAEAVIVQTDQTGSNGGCITSIDDPIKTVVSKQNQGIAQPFIVKYYGTANDPVSVDQPLPTVTTKDRFLLVEPHTGVAIAELDILFRMLQPHELAASHSFPKEYKFLGSKAEQTKQIGNSVCVELANAHIQAFSV